MKVSVIIPSYNSASTLMKTLTELLRQTAVEKIREIIVVDSSTDGDTPRMISELFRDTIVRGVHAGVLVMPAVARNIGAREAEGDLLLFIDADAFPALDWVEKILAAREQGILSGGGSIDIPDFQKNRVLPLAQFFIQFNEYTPHRVKEKKPFSPSCNLFCDKELFERVNGFPEIRASEDVLFGHEVSRLTDYWFLPEARVYHIFRESWTSFFKNMRLLGKYIFVYRKFANESLWYLKGSWPVFLAPFFAFLKWFFLTGRVVAAGPGYALRYLISLPAVLAGMINWAMGFSEGVLSEKF